MEELKKTYVDGYTKSFKEQSRKIADDEFTQYKNFLMVEKLPGKTGIPRKHLANWMGGATYNIDRRNYKVYRSMLEE